MPTLIIDELATCPYCKWKGPLVDRARHIREGHPSPEKKSVREL